LMIKKIEIFIKIIIKSTMMLFKKDYNEWTNYTVGIKTNCQRSTI